MFNLRNYLRYYNLEEYLFHDVHQRFLEAGTIAREDFFAIVVWKSNRAKTKVQTGIRQSGKTVGEIMKEVSSTPEPVEKILVLKSVFGIGLPIASAILAVCYPNDFTVVDYRAPGAVKALDTTIQILGNPSTNIQAYLEYVRICKSLAKQYGLSLRDFDRALWGYDFYAGKGGIESL